MWCNELMAYRCVCVSIYLSVYPSTIRIYAFSWICLDGFSWYLDTMMIRWGDNRGVQEFGVRGHLGVIWGHYSNTLKTLLRLQISIDFDETWGKQSLARGSFGVFRNFWPAVVLGSFGVDVDHWVFNLLKTAAIELMRPYMISAWVNVLYTKASVHAQLKTLISMFGSLKALMHANWKQQVPVVCGLVVLPGGP